MNSTAESPISLDLLLSEVGCFASCEAAVSIRNRLSQQGSDFGWIKSATDLEPQTIKLALRIRDAVDQFIIDATKQEVA